MTIYLGAAAVHKHSVHLPVQEGPGATAKVTFSLVRAFDRLPVLIDRVASIDVGPDHLTVTPSAGRARSASSSPTRTGTRLPWRCARNSPTCTSARWPTATSPGTRGSRSRRATMRSCAPPGHCGPAAVQPDLHGSQRWARPAAPERSAGTDEPAIVQIARTAQRPFAVPWQCCTTCRWNTPRKSCCPARSVSSARAELAPGPRPRCARIRTYISAPIQHCCVRGVWGLAHILEVPEPPPGDRSLDQVIGADGTAPAVLVGTGAGLDRRVLSRHLDQLGQQVAGFPASTGIVTAARALRAALEPTAMGIVYLLSHAEQAGHWAQLGPGVPGPEAHQR